MNESIDQYSVFISELTNFELLELYAAYSANVQQSWTIFVSALFAYLIAAHLVGKKLSHFEVWTISIVYSLFSLQILNNLAGDNLFRALILGRIMGFEYSGGALLVLSAALYVAALVLSLMFMYRARRKH